MGLSANTMRGAIRYLPGAGKLAAINRLVVWPPTTAPVYGNHIRPTAEPSGTAAKGDFYFDSTANCLRTYTGSAWEDVGQSPTGNVTIGGTLDVTGAVNYKRQVTDTGGAFATPIVLTTAQSGRVIKLDDAAGLDFTLPAIGASDVGTWFRFVCTVSATSNSYRFTAQAADLLKGGVWMVDFDDAYTAPQGVFLEPDGSDDLIMTMNGSTTGGKAGTDIEFLAVSATEWFVSGTVVGDGVLATPFS